MKDLSVRQQGDIVEVRIYATYGDRIPTFKGKARLGNQKEVNRLFEAAVTKGLSLPPPVKKVVRPEWLKGKF